jgi:DNA-directed RNA polymerase specialized sigma24 family protein
MTAAQTTEMWHEFNALVEETYFEMRRYARSVCSRTWVDPEDIYTLAWIEMRRVFPRSSIDHRRPVPFKVYFRRVIQSKFRKAYVILRRRNEILATVYHEAELNAYRQVLSCEQGFIENQLSPRLKCALSSISLNERYIIYLCAEGYSSAEAAAFLGLAEPDYVQELKRIRFRLMALLRQYARKHAQRSQLLPLGDWLTARQIQAKLQEAHVWYSYNPLLAKLKQLPFSPEHRLYPDGRTVLAWPPEAVAALEQGANERRALPPIGVYETKKAVAKDVDRSGQWVEKHTKILGILSSQRLNANGRATMCYPPGTGDRLKAYIASSRSADGWLTVRGFATRLGRTDYWVVQRLKQYSDLAEDRLCNSLLHKHWPDSLLEILQKESDEQRARDTERAAV